MRIKGRPDTQRVDLAGQRFGRLLVVSYAETRKRRAYWNCLCDCGNAPVMLGKDLRSGHSQSCGCRERMKHGYQQHRFYYTYMGMMKRCYDQNHVGYQNYGGRGITVCDEWRQDIARFIAWCDSIEEIPTGHTLDRKNNDGNYEPGNCRFASKREQQLNSRRYQQSCAHEL